MADFDRKKNYDSYILTNREKTSFICPCCGKSFPKGEAKVEKWDLYKDLEYVHGQGFCTIKHSCGLRFCSKCFTHRKWQVTIPLTIAKILICFAIISTAATSFIDFANIGCYVLGGWLLVATPLWLLIWLIPNLILWKSHKKLDFDDMLNKNAVVWNPQHFDD